MDDNPPTLGMLIRSLRARNGWTLKEMSEKTGIPLSTLAKVEHDRLTLGYDKLLQISQRLKIKMSDLFAGSSDAPESPQMTRRSIGTLDTAVRVDSKNYEYFFLCPDLRKKRMLPMAARLRAKTLEEFGDLVRHAGEEFLYVLSGRIEVHTEFYAPVTLETGQCVYIDSTMGHAYVVGAGCEEAMVIGSCSDIDDTLLNSLPEASPRAVAEPVVRLLERPTVKRVTAAAHSRSKAHSHRR
jgi:transcriptional regulator with XRE-family HTH domain